MFGAFSVKEKTVSYSLIFNEYFTHHKIKDSIKKYIESSISQSLLLSVDGLLTCILMNWTTQYKLIIASSMKTVPIVSVENNHIRL